jgi:hypothetical protein
MNISLNEIKLYKNINFTIFTECYSFNYTHIINSAVTPTEGLIINDQDSS